MRILFDFDLFRINYINSALLDTMVGAKANMVKVLQPYASEIEKRNGVVIIVLNDFKIGVETINLDDMESVLRPIFVRDFNINKVFDDMKGAQGN